MVYSSVVLGPFVPCPVPSLLWHVTARWNQGGGSILALLSGAHLRLHCAGRSDRTSGWRPVCSPARPRGSRQTLPQAHPWQQPLSSALIPFRPCPPLLPSEAAGARDRLFVLGLNRLALAPREQLSQLALEISEAMSSWLSDSSAAGGAVISLNLCRLLNKHLQGSGTEKPSHFCKQIVMLH